MEACQIDLGPALDFVFLEKWREVSASAANPGNEVREMPHLELASALRPRLKADFCGQFSLVAAPHLDIEVSQAKVARKTRTERFRQSASWAELHGSMTLGDHLVVGYGIQNQQWGTAEAGSPTNLFFPEGVPQRLLFHYTKGTELFRMSLASGREWSLNLLAEPKAVVPDEGKRSVARLAYNGQSVELGTLVGIAENARPWFGELAAVDLWEGWSIYGEAAHKPRLPVPRASRNAAGLWRIDPWRVHGKGLLTQAVAGTRYLFEGGSEIRMEYLFNEAGLSSSELVRLQRSGGGISPLAEVNSALVARVSRTPLTRQHLYSSLRLSELGPSKKWTVVAWGVHALADDTGTASLMTDWQASDRATLALALKGSYGPRDGDATRAERWVVELGQKLSW